MKYNDHVWRGLQAVVAILCLTFCWGAVGQGQELEALLGKDGGAEKEINNRLMTSIPIRPGALSSVILSVDPVSFLELDTLLLAGKLEPGQSHPEAMTMRSPASGQVFLILHVELKERMTIGRHDYRLLYGVNAYRCLALTRGNEVFDPRRWEIAPDGSGLPVRLLYEIPIPSGRDVGRLMSGFDLAIPFPEVEIPIVPAFAKAPPAPPAPIPAEVPANPVVETPQDGAVKVPDAAVEVAEAATETAKVEDAPVVAEKAPAVPEPAAANAKAAAPKKEEAPPPPVKPESKEVDTKSLWR